MERALSRNSGNSSGRRRGREQQARLPVRAQRIARPVCLLHPRPAGRGRARYVPAALAGVVRRYLRRGTEVEAVLAEQGTMLSIEMEVHELNDALS